MKSIQLQKMKHSEIPKALEGELAKIPRWQLLLYLASNGEVSAYTISKDLSWNSGKTHSLLKTLKKADTIETRFVQKNGRLLKMVKLKSN